MNSIRSKLLILVVTMFVFTGYTHAVVSTCCVNEKHEQAEQGNTDPANDDCCPCLCHKVPTNVLPTAARLPVPVAVSEIRFPSDEFPPDVEPQGIDHPPQLA